MTKLTAAQRELLEIASGFTHGYVLLPSERRTAAVLIRRGLAEFGLANALAPYPSLTLTPAGRAAVEEGDGEP